jgi:Suppressor of fused protein (SUFU)
VLNYLREVGRFRHVPTLRRGSSQNSRIAATAATTARSGGSRGSADSGGSAGRAAGPDGSARRAGQAAILLDSVSPYGSRRVTVEYDGPTTSAYLHDRSGPIAATWIANHQPAPDTVDVGRLRAGVSPEMPADHTKHPDGRPPLEPKSLSAVWLEEGDGVAILEYDEPLAVIPGWADLQRSMPGYSRDVIGQTPFAWSLDDALEGLSQRIRQSAQFWRWRASAGSWALFQQSMLGHLLTRLGPGGGYWDVSGGKVPAVGVSERPPLPRRPFTVLSTVGMSGQRMPVVEQTGEGAEGRARIELALATTIPSAEAARIFLWLAQYPWREVTWLGNGHSIPWYHEPATFPLGGGNEAVLLLDDPSRLPGPEMPRLDGFRSSNEPVRWLWIVPITERERRLARERSSASLVTHLAAQRRSWVYSR